MFIRKFFVTVLFVISAFSAMAQMALQITANQTAYLKYEPIYIHIGIRNDSGRPLVFGQGEKLQAKLFFEVTDLKNKPVFAKAPEAIAMNRGKVINPGQVGEIVLKFSHYYPLHEDGAYRIHAYISHPLFKEKFRSNSIRLDVVSGVTVWSRTIGVPDGKINNDRIISHDSTRTYSIKKLNTNASQFYYCTLEDKDHLYQVFRMAPVIGGDLPSCLVDMTGTLHALVKINSKISKYYKVDISGVMLDDSKYYKITRTSPVLVKGDDGKIFVTGGAPAVPDVDFTVREKEFTNFGDD